MVDVQHGNEKMRLDYLYPGLEHKRKLDIVLDICKKENITLAEVAYVGDDIKCHEILKELGCSACPCNVLSKIKKIPNINLLSKKRGDGAVREFVDIILDN
jgi:3-deoxy-D-manno-octulosonate 8-phosphate phosphatase KdsC-like HAD superfamily phosphatase